MVGRTVDRRTPVPAAMARALACPAAADLVSRALWDVAYLRDDAHYFDDPRDPRDLLPELLRVNGKLRMLASQNIDGLDLRVVRDRTKV